MEKPLKDLWAALAQRIVQALLYPCAKAVQRNTKSRDSNLWHVCSSPSKFRLVPGFNDLTAAPASTCPMRLKSNDCLIAHVAQSSVFEGWGF
jgi:hypothetical protein